MSPTELVSRPPFSDDAYWRPAIDNYAKKGRAKPLLTVYEWQKFQEEVDSQVGARMPVTNRLIKEEAVYSPSPSTDHPAPEFIEESSFGVTFDIWLLPLPTVWSEWNVSKVGVWPNRPCTPDSVYLEACVRRVCQKQEQVLLGLEEPFVAKDEQGRESGPVYGLKTFPGALQVPVISPTSPDFKAVGVVASVMEMRQALHDAYYYGPYLLIYGRAWKARMRDDYDAEDREGITLGQRINEIGSILPEPVVTDALPDTDESLFLVQATPDVIRIIPTQKPVVIQWADDTFRVVMSMTPQIRGSQDGQTGICIGTPRK